MCHTYCDTDPHTLTHTQNHKPVTVHSTPPSPPTPSDSPADGGGQEDKVGPQQVLHQRQRDGSRLIHAHQLRLAQLHTVTGVDVLQGVHTLLLGWMYCKAYTVTGWMYRKGYTHTLFLGDGPQWVHTHCYWVDVLQGGHTLLLGKRTRRSELTSTLRELPRLTGCEATALN